MNRSLLLRRASLVLCLHACASLASAETPAGDPLQRGYHLLYSGERAAAVAHFEALLKRRPDDLSLRCGWLVAQRERLDDATRRAEYEAALDTLIAAAEQRHESNADDDEALFYLANGYLLRAGYRVEHDQGMLAAARDGKHSKTHIEAYLKRHPENGDAYFALGMYNYYVDVAPTFVHFLRFLLFLPAGDRVEGLRQLERTAAHGRLLGPLARTMLMEIYARLEGRGADAGAMGESLRLEYPGNDEIALQLAGIYTGPLFEDRVRAAALYEGVIARHPDELTPERAATRANALLGLAAVKQEEWRIEEAIATLTPTIDAKVVTPDWVLPQFLIRRSNYRMLLDDPRAAADAQRVLDDPTLGRWHDGARTMLDTIKQRQASGEAAAYAALIPGNQLVVAGRWSEALHAYESVRARYPQSPTVRYRFAYLDFARGRPEAALPAFTALATGGRSVPEAIRAQALLFVGRIHDLAGRRDEAKRAYQRVIDDFGKQRPVFAARVGLITPYRRPAATPAAR